MNVQWDFPKHWPTREKNMKGPITMKWDCLKLGFYSLGYGGRDIRITKKRGSNSWEKLYTAWIDGIAVAKSTSLPEAKRLAIRLVDQGKQLVPLDADEMETAEPWPDAVEHSSEIAEPTPSFLNDTKRQNGTDPSSLYFTISGKLNISSLSTLEGTVDLLRESGTVTCTVTLPSRISL